MLKNVTKRTKLSLLIIGLIFTGVLGTLAFFDSKSTDAAAGNEYVVNSTGGETGSCDATCSFYDALDDAGNDGTSSLITFDLTYPAIISYDDGPGGAIHLMESHSNLEIRGPGAENLIFDGTNNPGSFIEFFPDCENVIVSGIRVQNNQGAAIDTYSSGSLDIIDNIFYENETGIRLRGLGENTVTNNQIIGGENGIATESNPDAGWECNSINNTITNNTISDVDGYGIAVSTIGNTVSRNTLSNTGTVGIGIYGDNNIVYNNTISDSGSEGIHAMDSDNVTISGNTLIDSGEDGIDFDRGDSNIISYNDISGSVSSGIILDDTTNSTVEHNDSYNNSSGILVNSEGEENLNIIRNNNFYENSNGVTILGPGDNLFNDNQIYENGLNVDSGSQVIGGIVLFDAQGENIFTNENIYDNQFGVKVSNSENAIFSDCVIDNSVEEDIAVGVDVGFGSNPEGSDYYTYFDNTDFDIDNITIEEGTLDINYDTQVHVVDQNDNNLEDTTITASYNPSFELGLTDEDGLTSYTSLDAALFTTSGLEENNYTFTVNYQDKTTSTESTLTQPSQEINLILDLTEPPPTYSISGYVKKDETGVENAELHIYDSEDDLLSILQTNSEGYYRSSDLEEGVYEIIIQPASLADLTGYTLLETNPRLVSLSGVDAEVDFNYSSIPVVNKNTNENVNGNSNKPYVNYNYNTNTNSNTNTNVNVNENGNININLNDNSNENQNINRQISLVNANINLNTNSSVEEPIIEQKIDQDFVLEGTAKPNTKIIITLELENGETLSIETITDSQGNWQVVFDNDKLLAGDHTIYIQTELNGQLSEMVELAKLVISGDKKISTTWLVVITVSILFIIIIIILLLLYAKRRNKKDQV